MEKCIDCLLNQTVEAFTIIIVDNASTDGTQELIKSKKEPRLKYYNTGSNLGGAGGFAYGIKKAAENKIDYCWLMDDDTFPEKDSLYSLLSKISSIPASYICSRVNWIDGNACLMNTPPTGKKGCFHNSKALDMHLIEIRGCSFVSCLISMTYIKKVGLPISEFFIYGDDVEYTRRLERIEKGYLDLDSVVVHAMPSNAASDLFLCDENRIGRYKYGVRNNIYIIRKYEKHCLSEVGRYVLYKLYGIIRYAKTKKWDRIKVLTIGFISGLRFNPKIEMLDKPID